jgi:ATP/maltotriose-dependent transcriptional regulator MalT/DNA-binding SARP family transcriptional activator
MAAMPSSSRAPVKEDDGTQPFVDVRRQRSLSFGTSDSTNRSQAPNETDREIRRAPIAVGPGHTAVVAPAVQGGGLPGAMSEFPVQISKVQAPVLRDQTLARGRLLDWLSAKVNNRVVLVIAEAGYGKTTLLADFSRRSRARMLWYRLDRGDRDWVGFIAHLAAAVRLHVGDFGAATEDLLRETAASAPLLDAVLDAFLRELGSLPPDSTILILDDFYLIDDTPEIRHIVKELIARAPERLTFVFASRRVPPVPLARLRALGEVAELGTNQLRFDQTETEELFRDTYEITLEPNLITELSRRTEGWAASLQLVRTALHDRDPTQKRAFISSLTGAEGHLYDYLAEEVIGDLPAPLQDFLMRTSILETIDLDLGPIAGGVSPATAQAFIEEGERLGLFSRRGLRGRRQVRSHPLVRQFLQARLARGMSDREVRDLHLRIALAAELNDWQVAAQHYLAAGADGRARQVVSNSIDQILAAGAYATAEELMRQTSNGGGSMAPELIVASRMAIRDADQASGRDLAERALIADPDSALAALNVITARSFAGDQTGALLASDDLARSGNDRYAQLARAFRLIIEASSTGSLESAATELDALLATLDGSESHYVGITYLNKANLALASGAGSALELAERAIAYLETASAGVELTAARLARAGALAQLGDLEAARAEASLARERAPRGQRLEAGVESAAIEVLFGDAEEAGRLLGELGDDVGPRTDFGEQGLLVRARYHLRQRDLSGATADVANVPPGALRNTIAFEAQRLTAIAQISLESGDPARARTHAAAAARLAHAQGARLWAQTAALLEMIAEPTADLDAAIRAASVDTPAALTLLADQVLGRIDELSPNSLKVVAEEAARRPARWRPSLRMLLDRPTPEVGPPAALLLEAIGEAEDVRRLRNAARHMRLSGSGFGGRLARRLAPRVVVEDLGRVRLLVGERPVEGTDVRRKVLALLCYLITRERFSATREEVLEGLWPELDPTSALNSLNQTVYFLRRVFEPSYREDESAGYVRQDVETIWLDPELIDARSGRCRDLIRELPREPDPDHARELARLYVGKFALDFAYDEWAATYRDSLHASYLRVIEQAIRADTSTGHFARAIEVAERASAVEPEAEEIQVALIRLYRMTGALSAASEQYGHYSTLLEGLGVEPPPFEAVISGKGLIGTPAY